MTDTVTSPTSTITSPTGRTLKLIATLNTTPTDSTEAKEVKVDFFHRLDKKLVTDDLDARRANPELIHQKSTSLCGMAVVAYFYAEIQYEDYRKFVLNLYADGTATSAAGYKLSTDATRHPAKYLSTDVKYPPDMSPADFILLASLRNQENALINYDPNGDDPGWLWEGAAAMTLPSVVSKLMKELVGLEVQDNTNLVFSIWEDTVLYLKSLQTKLESKKSCIALFINSHLLSNEKAWITTPNHWIGLKNVSFDAKAENITLEYYSWGKIRTSIGGIPFDVFKDCCFGHIEGK